MPTYDYRCRDCGHQFEIHQSFTDDPLTECPECSGDLRKVFSPVGITFKGSGFYKTDSRAPASSGNGNGKADAPSTEKKESSTSSSTSDSSTPSTKTESSSTAATPAA